MRNTTFRDYALAKTAEDYGFYPERGTLANDINAGAFMGGAAGAGLLGLYLDKGLENDARNMKRLRDMALLENGKLPARWKAAGMLAAGLAGSVPGGLLGMAHHGVRSALFDD